MSAIVRDFDGCEWNPATDSEATDRDGHYATTRATVIVGANGKYRLCFDCAMLRRFRRFKKTRIGERDPKTGCEVGCTCAEG